MTPQRNGSEKHWWIHSKKVQQTIFCGLSARKARMFSSVSSCKSLISNLKSWHPCRLRLEAACNFIRKQYNLMHNEIGYTMIHTTMYFKLKFTFDPQPFSGYVSSFNFPIFPASYPKDSKHAQLNRTSSVLSPEKRFMTLVCQMRHGDQVALGSTNWGIHLPIANSFWVTLLHWGWKCVKINGTHQYINQAVSLGGAIANYALKKSSPIFRLGTLEGQALRGVILCHAFLSNRAIREIFCVSVETFQQGLRHFTGIGGFLRRNGGTLSISICKGQANRSLWNWMNSEVNSLFF